MIKRRVYRYCHLVAYAVLCCVCSVTLAAQARDLTIGVVYAPDDARYEAKRLEKSYPGQPLGRPKAGAEVAIAESSFQLDSAHVKIVLQDVPLDNVQQARAQIVALAQKGVKHFLLDLPGAMAAELSKALATTDVLLFNVSAREDSLRGVACSANLFHTLPDDAMMADATAQFLTAHRWTRVLLLTGVQAADAPQVAATRQAIKRYGIKVIADKTFKLSNDPREREQGDVALLTAGTDADVVWVVDADGEFASSVPYRTNQPRLVVGSAGLAPEAWKPRGTVMARSNCRAASKKRRADRWPAPIGRHGWRPRRSSKSPSNFPIHASIGAPCAARIWCWTVSRARACRSVRGISNCASRYFSRRAASAAGLPASRRSTASCILRITSTRWAPTKKNRRAS